MATELWIWHNYNLLLLALLATGCAECSTTTDQDGKPLPEGYIGGLRCCADGQHCAVAEGFNGEERTFHMKYTWEYFDWNDCLISTQNFAFDITKHED